MYAWNQEGVKIFEVMTVKNNGVIIGNGRKGDRDYTFMAVVNNHGWYIDIYDSINRNERFQGATFNLLLEVASAIRRAL